jgi:hypothetical protein
MFLPMIELNDSSDRNIAYEVGIAFRCVEMGYNAISAQPDEGLTVKEDNEIAEKVIKFQGAKHNLFEKVLSYRNYGLLGQLGEELDDPQDIYALLLMGEPAAELYGGGTAYNCAAILQSYVARSKIDHALNILDLSSLEHIDCCDGFSVGSHFKGLTLYELSLLSSMTVQGVKNELRKPGSPATRIEDRASQQDDENSSYKIPNLVTVDTLEAYDWLKERRGFVSTYNIVEKDMNSLLVPQAKDGSFFNASCALKQGFKIGKKGEEVYVKDFNKAVDDLKAMPKAYWRRPSPSSGVSGIVSASTWVSKSKEELSLSN